MVASETWNFRAMAQLDMPLTLASAISFLSLSVSFATFPTFPVNFR
jgi:hypothetical protein